MDNLNRFEELKAALEEMENAGRALRTALIKRETDAIWEAVARQEQATACFARLAQTPEIFEALDSEAGNVIRERAMRARTIQRVNRALTRVFMKVVEKTLNALGNPGGTPLTYSPGGQFQHSPGPMFVQQTG